MSAPRTREVARVEHQSQSRPAADPAARDYHADYYQALHENSAKYQTNNWLIEELPTLLGIAARSILEVGCGNGLFLQHAVAHWPEVTGVDWARSPVLERVLRDHPTIRFVRADLATYQPDDRVDLLASADVLEHLPPAALPGVIRRLHAAAEASFHKIACYDDGHSHLSIFNAEEWLQVFAQACPGAGYRILRQEFRAKRRRKGVVVITNAEGCR